MTGSLFFGFGGFDGLRGKQCVLIRAEAACVGPAERVAKPRTVAFARNATVVQM